MQQGFEEHGFAGARVACEGHVTDLFGAVRHEAVSPCFFEKSGHGWPGSCGGIRIRVMVGGAERVFFAVRPIFERDSQFLQLIA
ncbi:MAG: hypothetical protein WKF61_01860, partial [Luteimonas sp.]